MTPALEIRDVNFSYGNSKVLSNANLTVEAGDFLAIVGPNGGGKTTLLRLSVGLLRPLSGTVRLFGESVPARNVSVGYVSQNTNRNLEFPITVEETVATGLSHYKANPEKVREALETVKMERFADRRLGELSGGERQRVLIARALAADPKILFLDEPSSNIDAQGQSDLYELLLALSGKMTIVMVSHDRAISSEHIKHFAWVNRTVQSLSREEFLQGVRGS